MALELESEIMNEIGLGQHYNWYNGSGSCQYIRQEAANRVAPAIQKYHEAGEPIAQPDEDLVAILKRVAAIGDNSQYSLTKTWKAASYVIAEHIHQAGATEQDRTKAYGRLKQYVEKTFLPERRILSLHDMNNMKDF
jgi:hypothetical protein